MYYLADQRIRTASEKYTPQLALTCRTLYQLHRLYRQGLVTQSVAQRVERLLTEKCPKELIELIAPTVD